MAEDRHAEAGQNQSAEATSHEERGLSPEVEGLDDLVADNDASQRASGDAGQFAGAGSPGAGGNPGGTSDAGGLGLPGGARRLGAGPSPTRDAGEGGTFNSGGLGTPGNAAAGSGGAHPSATPDTPPQGPVHGMDYPQAGIRPSERDHHGHLSLAGGSAGSGGGGADLLDEPGQEVHDERPEEGSHPPSS